VTTTQRNRRLGMGLGLLIALAVVLWLIFGGHRYVTTENAYIKIDMISLTADVSGPLVAVNVERNQPVRRGQVLAEVDPQPYRIALAEARADQRAVRNRILSERADYARLQAQRAQARRDLSYYQRELQRFQGLDKVAVSQSQLEAARQKRDKARADAEVISWTRPNTTWPTPASWPPPTVFSAVLRRWSVSASTRACRCSPWPATAPPGWKPT